MPTRLLLEGDNLEALLAQVRDEHGADATIVSAERVRSGGLAGFFAKERYELTVQVDDLTQQQGQRPGPTPSARPGPAPSAGQAALPAPASAPGPGARPAAGPATSLEALAALADRADAIRTDASLADTIKTGTALADTALADAIKTDAVMAERQPTFAEALDAARLAATGTRQRPLAVQQPERPASDLPVPQRTTAQQAALHRPAAAEPGQRPAAVAQPVPNDTFAQLAAAIQRAANGSDQERRSASEPVAQPPTVRPIRSQPDLARPFVPEHDILAMATGIAQGTAAGTTRAPNATASPSTTTSPSTTASPSTTTSPSTIRGRRGAGADRSTVRRSRGMAGQLAELGLPRELADQVRNGDSYLAIAELLEQFAPAAEVPDGPGEILAVLGDAPGAMSLAGALVAQLRLTAQVTAIVGPNTPGMAAGTQLSGAAAAQRWAEGARRLDTPAILVVEADPDPASVRWATRVLAAVSPDAVWAVLDATRKTTDCASWLAALGGVDAVAVQGTKATSDPASVLGLGTPVAMIDNRPADPHTWAALLCERLAARRPAEAGTRRGTARRRSGSGATSPTTPKAAAADPCPPAERNDGLGAPNAPGAPGAPDEVPVSTARSSVAARIGARYEIR